MDNKRELAVFDFDGTITRKDTLLDFLVKNFGRRKVVTGFLLHTPLLLLYKIGVVSNRKAKERLWAWFFKGMTEIDFQVRCKRYAGYISRIVNPEALACIRHHQEAGREVVIVSASVEDWIRPWAVREGITRVVGTQVAVTTDKILTGTFATPNCYGQEKVNRLSELYPDRGAYVVYAYGDSRGDRELLAWSDYAFFQKFN